MATPNPASDPPAKPEPPELDGQAMPAPVKSDVLTPEEQMARFEKELKESDWGHQPC